MADGSDLHQVKQRLLEREASFVQAVSARSNSQRLLIFGLFTHNQHFSYIWHLVCYWSECRLSGHLDVVVSPQFLQEYPDILTLVEQQRNQNIRLITIASNFPAPFAEDDRSGFVFQPFRAWKMLCDYARKLQATECLVINLDIYALAIALAPQAPCPISGLCLHPMHAHADAWETTLGGFGLIRSWQQKTLLCRMLRRSHLKRLFCVDPLVVKLPADLDPLGKAVPLPDPVYQCSTDLEREQILCDQWKIEPGRRVFLQVGDLGQEQELGTLFEAIAQLPTDICRQICLVLVGPVNAETQSRLAYQIARLRHCCPVQIVMQIQRVRSLELQTFIKLADVVIASSQKYGYLNGLLTWAAALQKPVLSLDKGLTGELVKRCQLGLTVEADEPAHLAAGLAYLTETPLEWVGDRLQMQQFAARNTAVRFAETVFRHLGP